MSGNRTRFFFNLPADYYSSNLFHTTMKTYLNKLTALAFYLTILTFNSSGGNIIKLSDRNWKFIGMGPQSEPIKKPDLAAPGWLSVKVPGDVNAALLENGKIKDPNFDVSAREDYWVTAKEWWYATTFDGSAENTGKSELVLEGVDGTADIWLNDSYLGIMKNAFYPHRFDVKGKLKEKGNVMLVRFQSIDQLLGGPRLDELAGWKHRRSYLRKPQFNFGWDWSLPLPSLGLSGDVYIENDRNFRFVNQSIRTFKNGRVDFEFEVSPETKNTGYSIMVNVEGHQAKIGKIIKRDVYKSYVSLQIPNAKLWYPNGYGEPNLYNYSVSLMVNGQEVETKKGRFGIREVETHENPFSEEAGPGFSFEIHINGDPVFCKGSNWIPCELWPATVKPDQYEFYLKKAKEANFNMLRIWGGGIYEKDLFYDLCDQYGIMVWQDFMFAGAGYSVNLLRDEIIKEADFQLRRLRNHPSVVLWCGMNEDVYAWSYPSKNQGTTGQADNGMYTGERDKWDVNRYVDDPIIYTMILRGLVSRFGLGVPYVESSPSPIMMTTAMFSIRAMPM